jgi:hypothetical protein
VDKNIRITALTILLLSSWTTAQAIPLYYTVSGGISQYGQNDASGIMQDMGLSTGDNVSYTFLIDLDSDITSSWKRLSTNYFDVTLVSGSVFDSDRVIPDGVVPGAPWSGHGATYYTNAANEHYPGEYYWGETEITGYAPTGYVSMLNYDDIFLTGEVTQLQPGDLFSAYNHTRIYNEQGDFSRFEVDTLRIVSITSENPASSVPEPGVAWLFGAGLIGLVSRRLKKA